MLIKRELQEYAVLVDRVEEAMRLSKELEKKLCREFDGASEFKFKQELRVLVCTLTGCILEADTELARVINS